MSFSSAGEHATDDKVVLPCHVERREVAVPEQGPQ